MSYITIQNIVSSSTFCLYPAQQIALGFAENDFEVVENDPEGRTLLIIKSGENIGTIDMTLLFFSLEEFRNNNFSETGFDITGLGTAES